MTELPITEWLEATAMDINTDITAYSPDGEPIELPAGARVKFRVGPMHDDWISVQVDRPGRVEIYTGWRPMLITPQSANGIRVTLEGEL